MAQVIKDKQPTEKITQWGLMQCLREMPSNIYKTDRGMELSAQFNNCVQF